MKGPILRPTEPLPLYHSWPIFERGKRFDLGYLFDAAALRGHSLVTLNPETLAAHKIGKWECDLHDNSLTWTNAVFDIFGLPRDSCISRREAVAFYCEESRAVMERLRRHAIRHSRGFTVDVEIRAIGGERRWMRLLAAPIIDDLRVVRLHGLKQDVTYEYR